MTFKLKNIYGKVVAQVDKRNYRQAVEYFELNYDSGGAFLISWDNKVKAVVLNEYMTLKLDV